MPRRILQGLVVSDYHAHDESNSIKVGAAVRIRECPPRSKLKRWEVYAD